MNKQEFLSAIRQGVGRLPENDVQRSLEYYNEMIEDRIEDGLSEEDAVAAMGDTDSIVRQILMDAPLPAVMRSQIQPSKSLQTWEIVLLVLGFPIWFPLFAAVVTVILAIYLSLWAIMLSLYAVDLSVLMVALAALVAGGASLFVAPGVQTVFFIGCGIASFGLAVLLFFAFNLMSKGLVYISRQLVRGIKSLFIRKEARR